MVAREWLKTMGSCLKVIVGHFGQPIRYLKAVGLALLN